MGAKDLTALDICICSHGGPGDLQRFIKTPISSPWLAVNALHT